MPSLKNFAARLPGGAARAWAPLPPPPWARSCGIVTAKTLRRRLFGLVGRLTRSARRITLRLPARWPWAAEFTAALARFRAIPLLA